LQLVTHIKNPVPMILMMIPIVNRMAKTLFVTRDGVEVKQGKQKDRISGWYDVHIEPDEQVDSSQDAKDQTSNETYRV
jgi:hypothetical protein